MVQPCSKFQTTSLVTEVTEKDMEGQSKEKVKEKETETEGEGEGTSKEELKEEREGLEKEEVQKEKACWRVGLKVAWDIHTPGLALPLQSGDCYYMTGTQSHSSVSRNSRLKHMCKVDCTVSVMLKCIRPGIIFPRGHPFINICVSVSLGLGFHGFLYHVYQRG